MVAATTVPPRPVLRQAALIFTRAPRDAGAGTGSPSFTMASMCGGAVGGVGWG